MAISLEPSPENKTETVENYESYGFPTGRVIEVDGVKYKAFTLEEYREIAHLLISYETMWEQADALEGYTLSLDVERELWKQRSTIWKQQCTLERNRGTLYENLWTREHQIRLNLERSQKLATWVPWTIVVLEAIALAGFGINEAVR